MSETKWPRPIIPTAEELEADPGYWIRQVMRLGNETDREWANALEEEGLSESRDAIGLYVKLRHWFPGWKYDRLRNARESAGHMPSHKALMQKGQVRETFGPDLPCEIVWLTAPALFQADDVYNFHELESLKVTLGPGICVYHSVKNRLHSDIWKMSHWPPKEEPAGGFQESDYPDEDEPMTEQSPEALPGGEDPMPGAATPMPGAAIPVGAATPDPAVGPPERFGPASSR